MKISKMFFPDYKYNSVNDIDIKLLKELGIKFAILDIDNTLVPYTSAKPDENTMIFLKKLEDNGIKYCFVSNNRSSRINTFNEDIGVSGYANSCKPLLIGINKAMKNFGATKENTVMIGDQIFTDVWGGKRAQITTILVEPIKECSGSFFRFKRHFEKIILRDYYDFKKDN